MAETENMKIRRTIRRHQLRDMVPLADSTIYEMEQRGEFLRRFALSPRCIVWDLAEVEAWLMHGGLPRSVEHSTLTSPSGKPGWPKDGIKLHHGHSLWQQLGGMLPTADSGVNGIGPFLHHMPALHLILGLVINAAR